MPEIEALRRNTLDELLFTRPGTAVVDVWGPQCQPCLQLAPTFDRLAKRFGKQANFYRLEAPANRMACVDLKVMSLPTFLLYRDGKETDRLTGEVSSEELASWVVQGLT